MGAHRVICESGCRVDGTFISSFDGFGIELPGQPLSQAVSLLLLGPSTNVLGVQAPERILNVSFGNGRQ